MNGKTMLLYEENGIWYFRGTAIKAGSQITIDGLSWTVLGISGSRSRAKSTFLWIRNDWYGTTIYVPSWSEEKPLLNKCLTAA